MSIATRARNRMNSEIRITPVRLIDAEGEQAGIVPIEEAMNAAQEAGLDLVEIAPTARPPVCRIMDWGKHVYEKQKADKEAKKKQHTVEVKELKFRPRTEEHDLEFKLRNAVKFLEQGNKVKITVRYRGRELRQPQVGHELMDEIVERISDHAEVVSRQRRLEGRQISMMLSPS
jgi:translation initiation factor IF-3